MPFSCGSGVVSPSCIPFCKPSLPTPLHLIRPGSEEVRRSWGLGRTLPVGEAPRQEGICGHRVYLTSPAPDWAANDSGTVESAGVRSWGETRRTGPHRLGCVLGACVMPRSPPAGTRQPGAVPGSVAQPVTLPSPSVSIAPSAGPKGWE